MSSKIEKSNWLSKIDMFDIATRQLIEMVEAVFHIEDLFELSKRNSFIALNFFQLITNIDYVIFVGMCHDPKQKITPAGGSSLSTELQSIFVGGASSFPNTLEGVFLAISHCFQIQAAKMDALIDVNVVTAFMQGTGAAQIAQDAVKAFATGGMDIMKMASKAAIAGA
jgi:hypothetical protein